MTSTTIEKVFRARFNGDPNFMTPDILTFGETPKYIYEISKGEGIYKEKIYGITFLEKTGQRISENDPSCMCYHMKEINKLISEN